MSRFDDLDGGDADVRTSKGNLDGVLEGVGVVGCCRGGAAGPRLSKGDPLAESDTVFDTASPAASAGRRSNPNAGPGGSADTTY
jgi:hypothetical protein